MLSKLPFWPYSDDDDEDFFKLIVSLENQKNGMNELNSQLINRSLFNLLASCGTSPLGTTNRP